MSNREQELTIDLDMMEDQAAGVDPDGLPRTDPGSNPQSAGAAATKGAKTSKAGGDERSGKDAVAEMARIKRDADRATRERDAAIARASEAETAARVAITERNRLEDIAIKRTGETLRSHAARVSADYQQIVSAITATQAQEQAARAAYADARDKGDVGRETEAMAALAEARAAIVQLETGKTAAERAVREAHALLDRQSDTPPRDDSRRSSDRADADVGQPQQRPQARQQTPEEWIDSAKSVIGDAGADWLRDHKEYVTTPKLNTRLLVFAEEYADNHGQEALKSEDFRNALNERFFSKESSDAGKSANAADDDAVVDTSDPSSSDPAKTAPQRKAAPSAPVSRPASVSKSPGSGGRVRLSADEQAIAIQMYPDKDRDAALRQYAVNKQRAMADGLYGR